MSRLKKMEKVDHWERKRQRRLRPMRQASIQEVSDGAPLMLPASAGRWQDMQRAARKKRREVMT